MNRHNSRAGRKVGAYMKVSLMFTSCLWLNLRASNMFSEVSNSVGSQKFRNINNKQKPPTVLTWPDTTKLAMFPKLYKIQTFSFFRNVATKSFLQLMTLFIAALVFFCRESRMISRNL